ncbi:signal peptidase II [Algisphaera agarilytica]|uniref:Lipoprotein signal peptidase n=1 Tax=Algisphaera agarilytica TaxID=1385975 RepID=A0A7X0LJB5_9BACT|nr:signal peptidase II [Algisphaera agarilytica]MBB6428672.1 lipoprotein signal peptidase [Algisphaera agarilytica]
MTDTSPDQSTPEQAQPIRLAGRSGRAIVFFVGVIIVALGVDLGLKYWSFDHVAGRKVVLTEEVTQDHRAFWSKYPHDATVVVPKVLELRLTTNTGAVFGLGKGNRVAFIAVSIVATAVIGLMFWRSPARAWLLHLALGMILAGALGNLYDRVLYRAVRDMLHMFPGVHLPFGLAWPGGITEVWPWIFNIADVALLAGVGLVLILTWKTEVDSKSSAKSAAKEKLATDSAD